MPAISLIICNGTVYTPTSVISDGAVLVRNGKIEKVGSRRELTRGQSETLDAEGNLICPGFIDLQVNGGGGAFLTEDADYESVCTIARTHSSFGTTSLMPTVMSAHENKICRALSAVSEAVRRGTGTASVIGRHLEGPFINEKKKGIHDERYLLQPSIDRFSSFYEASEGTLRLLTLAPELPKSLTVIELAPLTSAETQVLSERLLNLQPRSSSPWQLENLNQKSRLTFLVEGS